MRSTAPCCPDKEHLIEGGREGGRTWIEAKRKWSMVCRGARRAPSTQLRAAVFRRHATVGRLVR
jgi:hypothetical protein